MNNCDYCYYILRIFNSCQLINNFSIFNYIMSFISCLIYILIISDFIFWLLKRDNRKFNIFLNIFINIIISNTIKKILKNKRPINYCSFGYGNPSNHSTIFSSILTYLILEKFLLPNKCLFKQNKFYKYEIPIIIILVLLNGYSRIYLNYHYFYQVQLGTILGIIITFFIFKLLSIFIFNLNEKERYNTFIYKFYYRFYMINNLDIGNYYINEIHQFNELFNKIIKENNIINNKKEEIIKVVNNINKLK